MSRIQKANKKKCKARIEIEGPSGSGKTYTGLLLAKAFGKCVVIDTEKGSASLYADKFDFDVLELEAPYTPERYIDAIRECENAEYDVILIDSMTPEWNGVGGCLEIQTKLGGRFQDWAKVTPRHNSFIEAILQSKCHIIATCRTKQGYVIDEQTRKVSKVGMDPEQRSGLDYEMTTVFSLNQNHMAEAKKDRTGLFDGKESVLTEATGKVLVDWLNSGAEPASVTKQPKAPDAFVTELEKLKVKIGDEKFNSTLEMHKIDDYTTVVDRETQIKLYSELSKIAA